MSLDATVLQRLLDGRHAERREQLREVLSRPEFAPPLDASREAYRAQVLQWARTLAAEGLTAPGLPPEYGGQGDFAANVAAFETLAFGDLSLLVKFGVQFGLWGGAIHQLGSRRHHERWLRAIAALELPGCFAMTEADHGSNVQGLRTTAVYDPEREEFVIETPDDGAAKEYIGNAARDGRMAAVFAQLTVDGTCHGVHALAVPIRDDAGGLCPGVRIEDDGAKLGLNGVDNGRIWFDGVRVEREALLDRYGTVDADGSYRSEIEDAGKRFFTMLGTLVQGRVCISAASVSAAKTALTIAVRHGLRRRQFAPPGREQEVVILDYRTHQRRLMPLLARTYALHFAQAELTDRFDQVMSAGDAAEERDRRELESLAAGLKATASRHATETIQTCRECCGGAGYMAVNRFAALKADTDIFTTFEGDNTVLLMLTAKGILTDYKDHFAELDPVEMATFVAGQVAETVVERLFARKIVQVLADAVPSRDDQGDLFDRELQLELFRWREGHIVASAAQRFRRGLAEGHDPFDVFRAVQNHAIDAARAHLASVVLEAFIAGVKACPDGPERDALSLLCDLYALQEIEAEKGFYQEHGRLSGPRCKQITREVNRLCNEVRGCAGELVDGFGIPDAILRAPIGLSAPNARACASPPASAPAGRP